MKIAVGGVLLAATASIAASYVVPKFVDPEQNLARIAKHVAAGPSSVEDAKRGKTELFGAIHTYLKNNGNDKTADLTSGLQKLLPASTYEVRVNELPRGIRIVEVDTLLQAHDFLVMKTSSGAKVFELQGFEVYDEGRVVNDTAGPVLAIIGHSGGQPPHKPMVRTYALLPDSINDVTDKLVPPIKGDGHAKFAADGHDIQLQLSPAGSKSSSQITYGLLRWKDARYTSDFGGKTASTVRASFLATAAPQPTPSNAPSPSAATAPSSTTSSAPAGQTPQSHVASGTAQHSTTPPTADSHHGRNNDSAALRAAATASPLIANVINQARTTGNAKIVVRGLTDQPVRMPPPSADSSNKPLMSTMPAAAEAGGHLRHQQTPAVAPTAAREAAAGTQSQSQKTASNTSTKHDGSSSSTKRHGSTGTGVVSVTGATLRAGGSRGAAAIGGIGHGEQVQIIGREQDWYHVRYNGQEGYIFSALVDTTGKLAAASASTAEPEVSHSGRRHHRKHGHNSTMLVADVTPAPAQQSEHSGTKRRHHRTREAVVEAPTLVP